MATRVYLRNDTAPITPSAWATGWGTPVTGNLTKAGSTARGGSANASLGAASGAVAATLPFMRFVYGPIGPHNFNAQTMKGQMRGQEANAAAQCAIAIAVRILKPDGTERAVLHAPAYATTVDTNPPELRTALTNNKFRDGNTNAYLDMANVTATNGDYLCIEVGVRKNAASTTRTITFRYGAADASNDLGEEDTGTNDYDQWVEFSSTITPYSATLTATAASAVSTVAAAVLAAVVSLSALAGSATSTAPTATRTATVTQQATAALSASATAATGITPGPVSVQGSAATSAATTPTATRSATVTVSSTAALSASTANAATIEVGEGGTTLPATAATSASSSATTGITPGAVSVQATAATSASSSSTAGVTPGAVSLAANASLSASSSGTATLNLITTLSATAANSVASAPVASCLYLTIWTATANCDTIIASQEDTATVHDWATTVETVHDLIEAGTILTVVALDGTMDTVVTYDETV